MGERGAKLGWGKGPVPLVNFYFPFGRKSLRVMAISAWPGTNGMLELAFGRLADQGVSLESLAHFSNQLRAIPGPSNRLDEVEQVAFQKYPTWPFDPTFASQEAVDTLVSAIDELLASG